MYLFVYISHCVLSSSHFYFIYSSQMSPVENSPWRAFPSTLQDRFLASSRRWIYREFQQCSLTVTALPFSEPRFCHLHYILGLWTVGRGSSLSWPYGKWLLLYISLRKFLELCLLLTSQFSIIPTPVVVCHSLYSSSQITGLVTDLYIW